MQQRTTTLLVSKTTRNIYETTDNEHFANVTTGTEGVLTPEQVKTTLAIPLRLNAAHQQNKYLIELIKRLGLAIEN